MPELLNPTNPTPGYDAARQVKAPTVPLPGDTSIQNIVDPSRVVRPDGQEGQQGTDDALNSAARYDSNFMTFLQRLRGAAELPEIFLRILQWGETEVSSGVRAGFASELGQFLEFLEMDEPQLAAFIKNQTESGSRFSGALFNLLRSAYTRSSSDLIKTDILQFIRRFSDFSSTEHLENKILRQSQDISESVPSPWAQKLREAYTQLETAVSIGNREGALKILREQFFPLVSRYVSATHDHGRPRKLFSMLTLDVARYANGSEKELVETFRHLVSNRVFPKDFEKLTDREILQLLRETDYTKTSENNSFADKLARLTHNALQGNGGAKAQEAFHNVMTSMLINESVYMPIQHIMIPLNWEGQLVFSELWIDRDAERSTRDMSPQGEGTLRILIKMDVESLGAFDLLFNSKQDTVSLYVGCPETVSEYSGLFSETLGYIMRRNGLNVGQVTVTQMKRSLTVSEVFPKILERMRGVNVKI